MHLKFENITIFADNALAVSGVDLKLGEEADITLDYHGALLLMKVLSANRARGIDSLSQPSCCLKWRRLLKLVFADITQYVCLSIDAVRSMDLFDPKI